MIVYHGTSGSALGSIVLRGLEARPRRYVSRPCACTTTRFAVAERFAIARTPIEEFLAGRSSGVVLEFSLVGDPRTDFESACDPWSIREEFEIAIYSPHAAVLVAVWRYEGGAWSRGSVPEANTVGGAAFLGEVDTPAPDRRIECG